MSRVPDVAEGTLADRRKKSLESVAAVPLFILDDFGVRKLPPDCRRRVARDGCPARERYPKSLTIPW
jgi:hypothetical protein